MADIQTIAIGASAICGGVSTIYSGLLYFLPTKKAKKLTKWVDKISKDGKKFKGIWKILNFLANTPGGLKSNDSKAQNK